MTLTLTCTLALAACGKEESKDGGGGGATASPGAMRVAYEAALPACDAAAENVLVYVEATKNFRVCTGGTWTVIDLSGKAGDKGEAGAAGANGADGSSEIAKAIAIYKASRKSVFRVETKCTVLASPASGCSTGDTFLGSAFLCGENKVCTNAHVAHCDAQCYSGLVSLKLQQIFQETDSVNDTGKAAGDTPSLFFETSDDSGFTFVAGEDLATIPIPSAPAGATVLKLATKAWNGLDNALAPVLSLSFPLGLQDLYVDVGYVNSPTLKECDTEGGQSGYGCPKELYDFSTTNDTDHGSSGSPLFDILTGEVIGVTSAGTEGENANFTWAIDASQF